MTWQGWCICTAFLVLGLAAGFALAWFLARKKGKVDPSIATRRKMMAEINRLSRKNEPFGVMLVEFHDLKGSEGAAAKREALEECHRILRIFCVEYLDPKTSGVLRGTGYGGIVRNAKNTEALAAKLINVFMTPLHVKGRTCLARASVGIRDVNDFFLPAWKVFAQADMAVSAARENSWVAWSQQMEDDILNIMGRENHACDPQEPENEAVKKTPADLQP